MPCSKQLSKHTLDQDKLAEGHASSEALGTLLLLLVQLAVVRILGKGCQQGELGAARLYALNTLHILTQARTCLLRAGLGALSILILVLVKLKVVRILRQGGQQGVLPALQRRPRTPQLVQQVAAQAAGLQRLCRHTLRRQSLM